MQAVHRHARRPPPRKDEKIPSWSESLGSWLPEAEPGPRPASHRTALHRPAVQGGAAAGEGAAEEQEARLSLDPAADGFGERGMADGYDDFDADSPVGPAAGRAMGRAVRLLCILHYLSSFEFVQM